MNTKQLQHVLKEAYVSLLPLFFFSHHNTLGDRCSTFFHGSGRNTKSLVLCTLIYTLMQDIHYQWTKETNRLMQKANSVLLKNKKGPPSGRRALFSLISNSFLGGGHFDGESGWSKVRQSHQFVPWKHRLCLTKEANVSKVPGATVS